MNFYNSVIHLDFNGYYFKFLNKEGLISLILVTEFVLIIRMGKQKLGESDSDDSDDDGTDDEKESEKSIVVNNGNHSDLSKEVEWSSGSVTNVKQDGGSCGGGSCESGSEEEKEIVAQGRKESDEQVEESPQQEQNNVVEPVTRDEKITQSSTLSCTEPADDNGSESVQDEKVVCNDPVKDNTDEVVGQLPKVCTSGCGEGVTTTSIVPEASHSLESNQEVNEETATGRNVTEVEEPLNFDLFNSATEMEVCL